MGNGLPLLSLFLSPLINAIKIVDAFRRFLQFYLTLPYFPVGSSHCINGCSSGSIALSGRFAQDIQAQILTKDRIVLQIKK